MMPCVSGDMDHKGFVNDHLRSEKKAAIFHAEREPISETLCDHSVMEAR